MKVGEVDRIEIKAGMMAEKLLIIQYRIFEKNYKVRLI